MQSDRKSRSLLGQDVIQTAVPQLPHHLVVPSPPLVLPQAPTDVAHPAFEGQSAPHAVPHLMVQQLALAEVDLPRHLLLPPLHHTHPLHDLLALGLLLPLLPLQLDDLDDLSRTPPTVLVHQLRVVVLVEADVLVVVSCCLWCRITSTHHY